MKKPIPAKTRIAACGHGCSLITRTRLAWLPQPAGGPEAARRGVDRPPSPASEAPGTPWHRTTVTRDDPSAICRAWSIVACACLSTASQAWKVAHSLARPLNNYGPISQAAAANECCKPLALVILGPEVFQVCLAHLAISIAVCGRTKLLCATSDQLLTIVNATRGWTSLLLSSLPLALHLAQTLGAPPDAAASRSPRAGEPAPHLQGEGRQSATRPMFFSSRSCKALRYSFFLAGNI